MDVFSRERGRRLFRQAANFLKEYLLCTLGVLRDYFSIHNWKIFLFMILSVIPASICEALYMSSDVIEVRGAREFFFHKIYYAKIPYEYDCIILPLSILIELNLGLFLMKFLGEIKKSKKNGKENQHFDKPFLVIVLVLLPVLFYSYGAFLTTFYGFLLIFLFFFAMLFLYFLGKASSKVIIFPLLVILNASIFVLFYNSFHPGAILESGTDDLIFILARAGILSLYILPYNFFLFFPLIIGVYFSNFKHPEQYLSSFFEVVSHENMVAVFLGLLLCVMFSFSPLFFVVSRGSMSLSPHPPLEVFGSIIMSLNRILSGFGVENIKIFEVLALFQLWIGSIILWITPFVISLTQLETKFEASFDRRLREIIQRMRDHIVVIGFGNLGRKVCTDLIERGVVSLTRDTTEILMPDLEVKKICKKLLVVDVNGDLFDRVHTDPILQDVGVARRKPRGESKKEDILIPAVVGDINSETTRDSSRLRRSKFFISAPSDYRATFVLSKLATAEDLDSIISVEDSAQKDYFSPKMSAHDTFFIYPAFQEGETLGRITSLCYLGLLEEGLKGGEEAEKPEIVIAGEGKQVNYLIETFWMEMERAGKLEEFRDREAEENETQKKYRLPFTFLTADKEILRESHRKTNERNKKWRQIEELLKRTASVEKYNSYFLIDGVFDVPYRLVTVEEIINRKKPRIVVVTSKKIQEVSKIFHEWVIAIERCLSTKEDEEKPRIIVGVLGDEYEEIQDVLLYYSTMGRRSESRYPIQSLDSAVRVYDDSTEKIGGLAQSLARKNNSRFGSKIVGELEEPFTLHCCLGDTPGSLGDILGRLAGISFKKKEFNNTKHLIDLHYCRFQSCSGVENYSFLANAVLRETFDSTPNIFCCLFQGENKEFRDKKTAYEVIKDLLGIRDKKTAYEVIKDLLGIRDKKTAYEVIKDLLGIDYIVDTLDGKAAELCLQQICSCCCRRVTCSISSYMRKVENLIENGKYYEDLERNKKFPEGTVERELNRFFVNKHFVCPDENTFLRRKDDPRADILVCCRNSGITGSLSTAVNNLLFREISGILDDGQPIADITYLRSYECYKPTLTDIEFYGNWIIPFKGKRELLEKSGSIDLVSISVATGRPAWIVYATELCEALNAIYARKEGRNSEQNDSYEVWVDREGNNIGVIRGGFRVKDEESSLPMKVNCNRSKCIIHNKVGLLTQRLR
jgi:hypothetical protein